MEPTELNGGRFYARTLLHDARVDDLPALSRALGEAIDADFVATARSDWHSDTRYTWVICEQTRVEALALAVLYPGPRPRLEVVPTAPPETALPNDPVLAPMTVGDALREGTATITRWAEGYLGLKLR
ncbi:hypothetical protein [Corynebacterium pacaense]|uniref:hypothetical protein n=1 Tax=Corynebacterium pacaense TaxID=1816684 RepID=UPI0009BC392D|nr:hypothetical protein [Corynebacterium pacaense]